MEKISLDIIKAALDSNPSITVQELVLTLKEHWIAYINQVFERETSFLVAEYARAATALIKEDELN